MTSKPRRRILQDISTLQLYPPADFFIPPVTPTSDDLHSTTIFLVGPACTPFEGGLFQVVLRIPNEYPTAPPRVHFRTQIFHPNIDERTGDVCVDTIKRDWNDKLTLVDVCAVVRCLLVYPNPDSSLNDTAGRLFRESYDEWASRAHMYVTIHAKIPQELEQLVAETRHKSERGDIVPAGELLKKAVGHDGRLPARKPVRRRTSDGRPPRGASPIMPPSDTEMGGTDASIPSSSNTSAVSITSSAFRLGKENTDGSFSKAPGTPTGSSVDLAVPGDNTTEGPSSSPRKRASEAEAAGGKKNSRSLTGGGLFSAFDLNASDVELAKRSERVHTRSSTGIVSGLAGEAAGGNEAVVESVESNNYPVVEKKKVVAKKRRHPPPRLGLKRY